MACHAHIFQKPTNLSVERIEADPQQARVSRLDCARLFPRNRGRLAGSAQEIEGVMGLADAIRGGCEGSAAQRQHMDGRQLTRICLDLLAGHTRWTVLYADAVWHSPIR